jgi:hypothetical protein
LEEEMKKKIEVSPWEEPVMKDKIQKLLEVDRKVTELTDGIIQLSQLSSTAALGVCKAAETIVRACIIHNISWGEKK